MFVGQIMIVVVFLSVFDVRGECTYNDDACEFHLYVENHLTMMDGQMLVSAREGSLYPYNVKQPQPSDVIPLENVITADGYSESRLVTVVNNSLPGPSLIMYDGQMVTVHVHNLLTSDGVTVHWHGLTQKGTPWMDGVAFITQCPILPGQTFTYRFRVTTPGTFWYHSHIGAQRSMGVQGAFIIRYRKPLEMKEHIFSIQDWNHDIDTELANLKVMYGNYENSKRIDKTVSIEHALYSTYTYHSGLINGRGRYYDNTGKHNGAPLSKFTIEKGTKYRFRLICTSFLYPFRVSVDGHMLTVVATDGMDVEPVTVQSIIINPGERYDFILNANQIEANYWIRARTLEINLNHTAEAILHYKGVGEGEPTSSPPPCTEHKKCLTLNCPFLEFPPEYNSTCLNVNKLHRKENPASSIPDNLRRKVTDLRYQIHTKHKVAEDVFLNFGFPGIARRPASVNGIHFKMPPISALTQMNEMGGEHQCDDKDCGEDKLCHCFHTVSLELGRTYHLVLVNMGIGREMSHPVHMHGHSFEILKMEFAQYNDDGEIIADNSDIDCRGKRKMSFCNQPTWADTSWHGNTVPGLELNHPPLKDTVIVPAGGYVIIRITADNPGLWFMHCHVDPHTSNGMALAINESLGDAPPPPEGFPECRDFRYDHHGIHNRSARSAEFSPDLPPIRKYITKEIIELTSLQFWTLLTLLLVVIALLLKVLESLFVNRRRGQHTSKCKAQTNRDK